MENSYVGYTIVSPEIPSLKIFASRKLIWYLWKNLSIMHALIDQSWMYYAMGFDFIRRNNFNHMVSIIKQWLHALLIEEILILETSIFIIPVGVEICNWLAENSSCVFFDNVTEFLNCIQWTYDGCIHKQNSIDCWAQHTDHLTVFKRACYYCSESSIRRLWQEMTDLSKYYCLYVSDDQIWVKYWLHRIYNKMEAFLMILKSYTGIIDYRRHIPMHFQEWAIRLELLEYLMVVISIIESNSSAVVYFMEMLGPQRLRSVAVNYGATAVHFADVRRYWFSIEPLEIVMYIFFSVNIEFQRHLMQKYCPRLLRIMADSLKYQYFLIPLVKTMWNFIDDESYSLMMEDIFNKILDRRTISPDLIAKIWTVSAPSLKFGFFEYILSKIQMLLLFEEENLYISRHLLKDADVTTRNTFSSFIEI